MADRVGPVVEDEGELPRSDLRRVRVRGEAWLSGCESGNRHGAEAVEGEAVEAGAAIPDRAGVGDRRTAGQETWGLLAVAAGTGLRFGELSALWVTDVDLDRGTVRVNKAWKRNGEDDATDTPGWLSRQLRAKHAMRDHHLGHPKTPRSRRTITIAPTVAALLKTRMDGRAADDFVFTSRTGLPLHNGDFYTHVWRKLMAAVKAEGLAPFRFHDLRHTHVAWLVAGGAPLPHIQARLGHESITTTIDTYGHLLPVGDELISRIIDMALTGGTIRPMSMP
jgi:integrase